MAKAVFLQLAESSFHEALSMAAICSVRDLGKMEDPPCIHGYLGASSHLMLCLNITSHP